ncbi:hypothetical protein CDAR_562901 [Caerostris darwini]|uniref:Transmembrane protein n=1 Tax=Caerostris darwini TaxID=1538125 RepID=A0AAV4X7N8_9ARAC|nr:hypothetical protein CDAR_562901 [Caerostris darwini]
MQLSSEHETKKGRHAIPKRRKSIFQPNLVLAISFFGPLILFIITGEMGGGDIGLCCRKSLNSCFHQHRDFHSTVLMLRKSLGGIVETNKSVVKSRK